VTALAVVRHRRALLAKLLTAHGAMAGGRAKLCKLAETFS
jgi:hypothetical protein